MIGAGRDGFDARLKFALHMGLTVRLWKTCSDRIAERAGLENHSIIPLYHLASNLGGLTQVELARRMKIAESTIVRMLPPLLRDGLVTRRRMIGDGRAWLIELGPNGIAAMEAFEPYAASVRSELLDCFTDEELDLCSRVLSTLNSRLSDLSRESSTM